ncbi:ribosome recycling factor [Ureaplasma canigenitalium]|uniref:ribosome recycling factor n=1 Tax=Ureaplasma canigenitalium TaxID=42092 RepID=UPI0004E227FD|nr:ribosome recycling factor [Ureaplasma canigenitalium]
MDFKVYDKMFKEQAEHVYTFMHNEFIKLRTGRASPSILDGILVDYYGSPTPINQTANISVPEPRILMIKPYDKSIIKDIVTALNGSNLNINPQVDADAIRLTFQAPTEDMRKQLAKKAKQIGEEAKIRIRHIRQEIQDAFKKEQSSIEDDKKHFQNELDKLTKEINNKVDELVLHKEKEIMTI